jgi:hypothetical protein
MIRVFLHIREKKKENALLYSQQQQLVSSIIILKFTEIDVVHTFCFFHSFPFDWIWISPSSCMWLPNYLIYKLVAGEEPGEFMKGLWPCGYLHYQAGNCRTMPAVPKYPLMSKKIFLLFIGADATINGDY